ncbi:flagellar motor switch protein FliN/FliY [Nitratiruptor sp. YY08-26]|uniref:FliM/FliN family flagellar motor switch protein n=1 Tax=unclassified Nitratiruptor TaxID=2624044 RepID=UPI0019156BB4|nr:MULTISPECIES: FliM/FliN family flagellar motor switch protein [unclassified Nitratiruptor]BCD61869.1 flagellar motor switch protein FliN/FliY [Nitratiruptor sp. YY08-13]BCD65804.1 flagellar motor switch protein FliN/FliY [Nitratiruptor sp. YY08-26]
MENPQNPGLEFLQDINLKLSINVGSVEKLLVEILALKEGDVIELDKSVEEYVTVTLNDAPFAIGEIVIANEKYGVRIVDLAG